MSLKSTRNEKPEEKDFLILTESIFHLKPLQQKPTGEIVLYKPKTCFQIYKDSKYLHAKGCLGDWSDLFPPPPRTEVTGRIQEIPEKASFSAEAIKEPVGN